MQKQLQILAMSIWLLAFSLTTTAQTTRRVNGDPNITGVNVYNTIQAAVDAANTDDVILIEVIGSTLGNSSPSSFDLGQVNISKKLVIRGHGAFKENSALGRSLFQSPTQSTSGSIYFNEGSEGSIVENISLQGVYIEVFVPNITFREAALGTIFLRSRQVDSNPSTSSGTDCKILKCSISRLLSNLFSVNGNALSSGLQIKNSFLAGLQGSSGSLYYHPLTNANISKCSIFQFGILGIDFSTIVDCIFYNSGFDNSSNSVGVSHCIAINGTLPALSNNISNAVIGDVWLDAVDRILTPTSLAKNFGINGEDIGEYGGVDPFNYLDFLPASPHCTDLLNSSVGNNNINIQVQATYIAN